MSFSNIFLTGKRALLLTLAVLSLIFVCCSVTYINDDILYYTVDPAQKRVSMFWKNSNNQPLGSIERLIQYLKAQNKDVLFAMNGGMYKRDLTPQGLFIKEKLEITPIDTTDGEGNFYMKPNGVFFITSDRKAGICKSESLQHQLKIEYATQSGPMLLIDGTIHPSFKEGSINLNIRNGVGILSNGTIVFAMSKKEINFYDFALFFKEMGCKNALYLDGFVSRAYLPEKDWKQTDGSFGVIIGVTEN